ASVSFTSASVSTTSRMVYTSYHSYTTPSRCSPRTLHQHFGAGCESLVLCPPRRCGGRVAANVEVATTLGGRCRPRAGDARLPARRGGGRRAGAAPEGDPPAHRAAHGLRQDSRLLPHRPATPRARAHPGPPHGAAGPGGGEP